jgi:hypothetical protein
LAPSRPSMHQHHHLHLCQTWWCLHLCQTWLWLQWRRSDGEWQWQWRRCDGAVIYSLEPNSIFFVFLCLFVVCSSWLYHSTYNTLEDMIEFWWQMVGNLTTHFPSQHSWLTYRGTGTRINVRHFDWWAGSKNWSKIFEWYGASLGGVQRVWLMSQKPHKKHKQHDKQHHLLAPPAVWIWWTHAAWGVGGLAHVRSNSAVEAIL